MAEKDKGGAPAAAPVSGVTTIKTRSPKSGREVEFDRNLGATLAETVALFGEDVTHSMATAQIEIRIQGAVRSALDAGYGKGKDGNPTVTDEKSTNSPQEAIKAGQDHTPGVARKGGGGRKSDPFAKIAEKIDSGEMSEADVLKMVKEKLAERKAA